MIPASANVTKVNCPVFGQSIVVVLEWGMYFVNALNLCCIFRVPCRYEENWQLLHVFLWNIDQLSRLCFHIVPPEQSRDSLTP